jgi:hypothetical protein
MTIQAVTGPLPRPKGAERHRCNGRNVVYCVLELKICGAKLLRWSAGLEYVQYFPGKSTDFSKSIKIKSVGRHQSVFRRRKLGAR